MSQSAFQIAPNLLTPSELVWIYADRFAGGRFLDNYYLPHLDARVSASQLIQAIIATAFLVNEKNGILRLETSEGRWFFNLFSSANLHVLPGTVDNPWPPRSIEYALRYFDDRLTADGKVTGVPEIVTLWLGTNVPDPLKLTMRRIERCIYVWEKYDRHGLREPVSAPITEFSISNEALSIAANQPIEPIRQLLQECETHRKTVWKKLTTGINSAITGRTADKDWGPTESIFD